MAQSSWARAEASWEVAVVFFGADEPAVFHQAIDRNMAELWRVELGREDGIRLSILRELPDHVVEYHPDPSSSELHPWDALFYEAPVASSPAQIQVPGALVSEARDPKLALVKYRARLSRFFAQAFRSPTARRLLIVYGHGLGPEGMKEIGLRDFRAQLESSLPTRRGRTPLDLLWLDACFMGNVEALYELRGLAPYSVGSEELEFMAASPFDALDDLERFRMPEAAAVRLAEQFLASYSTVHGGGQSSVVKKSSATIAVVDNEKLGSWVQRFGEAVMSLQSKLSPSERQSLRETIASQAAGIRMNAEDDSLLDLGNLLRVIGNEKTATTAFSRSLDELELGATRMDSSVSRITLRAPRSANVEEALLVFGYEGWTRGDRTDAEIQGRLPDELKAGSSDFAGFIDGPNGKKWPAVVVRKSATLAPFVVGTRKFDFYFVDRETRNPLTQPKSYARSTDVSYRRAQSTSNPILFQGATHASGSRSERYTGLSILNPTTELPPLEYRDSEFQRVVPWLDWVRAN